MSKRPASRWHRLLGGAAVLVFLSGVAAAATHEPPGRSVTSADGPTAPGAAPSSTSTSTPTVPETSPPRGDTTAPPPSTDSPAPATSALTTTTTSITAPASTVLSNSSSCADAAPEATRTGLYFLQPETGALTFADFGTGTGGVQRMAWSPRSDRVAVLLSGEMQEVVVVGTDGAIHYRSGDTLPGVGIVSWTADGSGVYVHNQSFDDPATDLEVIDVTSGERTLVWDSRISLNHWAADPRHDRLVVDDGGTIWVMNGDGQGARKVPGGGSLPYFVKFSLDGSRVSFARESGAGWLDLDDLSFHQVIQGSMSQFRDFSPDGRYVAAVMERDGGHHVVVATAEGREVATYPHNYWGGWDHTSSVLTITDFRNDSLYPENVRISRLDLTTGMRHEIAHPAGVVGWSPSEDHLLARFNEPRESFVWCVTDSSFREWTPLLRTTAPATPGGADWSPDGSTIVFSVSVRDGGGLPIS